MQNDAWLVVWLEDGNVSMETCEIVNFLGFVKNPVIPQNLGFSMENTAFHRDPVLFLGFRILLV